MTTDTFQEGNKIIAEFDNYEQVPEGLKEEFWRYHKDWSWLMPVWHRFRDLSFKGNIKEHHEHQIFKGEIEKAICYGTITDAFNELVQGIEWYNQVERNLD